VRYPVSSAEIVLRAELDWSRDIPASAVSADRATWDFSIETDRPFLYFKPMLAEGGRRLWSTGKNYLAMSSEEVRELYTFFYSGERGSISPPLAIAQGRNPVRIYTPAGYSENALKRYPVLYMHDGKNLFFPDEAFAGVEWRVDETMELLDAMNAIDRVIVVGVYSGDRMSEYTRPGYEAYGRFLVEELKPWVDERYRTLPGPKTTGVMGSSLGGVVSLFLAWQWPGVFGKAACLSSTFGYRDDLAERIAREPRNPIELYLDSGWPGDNYEVTRNVRDLLMQRGYSFGRDLLYFAFPEALHDEQSWATRSHLPFQFLFGRK
jgi:predicted alpha/beta superfamily hydrolase